MVAGLVAAGSPATCGLLALALTRRAERTYACSGAPADCVIAAMTLLGDWNWYLPRWLEWLPKLETERSPEVTPEPEPARLAA